MLSRSAAVLFGGFLAFGGVAATAGTAFAVDATPTTTAPTSPTPNAAVPYTVTIPGVGTLSLTLDPATGAVSDVVVTPAEGLTAGTPTVTTEGVKVVLTATDGTVRVLEAQVEQSEHGVRIETEVDTEADTQHTDHESAQGAAHENDHKGPDNNTVHGHSGDHHGDPGTSVSTPPPSNTNDRATTTSVAQPDHHRNQSGSSHDLGTGRGGPGGDTGGSTSHGSHGSHD